MGPTITLTNIDQTYNITMRPGTPKGQPLFFGAALMYLHGFNVTQLPLNKMGAILQTVISNAFSWMKRSVFHWNFTEVCYQAFNWQSILFKLKVWRQNQCWSTSQTHICGTRGGGDELIHKCSPRIWWCPYYASMWPPQVYKCTFGRCRTNCNWLFMSYLKMK